MTQVRSVSYGIHGPVLGLFATQPYAPGQVILEEAPIIVLTPSNQSEHDTCIHMFRTYKNGKGQQGPRLQDFIKQLVLLPNTLEPQDQGKFYGMIVALVTYAAATPLPPDHVLWKLYSPTIMDTTNSCDPEYKILLIAEQAMKALEPLTIENSPLYTLLTTQPNTCLRIMLLWSYNAFQDGLIFERISRVNHSCDPNATITSATTSKQQHVHKLVATTPIDTGDEITLSYLGIFTFAGFVTRRQQLIFSKHFTCSCSRCVKESSITGLDIASAIPCPKCHPRNGNGRYLLEDDLHYDDFHETSTVQYAVPLGSSDSDGPFYCPSCHMVPMEDKMISFHRKVIQRITSHVQDLTPHFINNKKNKSEDKRADLDLVEELFHLSSSVLGARHWCTNLLLLQCLEKNLASLHAAMLLSHAQEEDPIDLVELAECIDSLSKLWFYFQSVLQLRAHPGHVLCGVTIGVARILVSLGDVKSKKYGAEWIDKVELYILQGHEGESMKVVVEKLKFAWLSGASASAIEEEEEEEEEAGQITRKKKSKWI